jgi:hypothetical protein
MAGNGVDVTVRKIMTAGRRLAKDGERFSTQTGQPDRTTSKTGHGETTRPGHCWACRSRANLRPRPTALLLDPESRQSSWFEALPMANIGETARQVYSTLVEFNRTEIPDLLRAKTVEKFRPPVEYIVAEPAETLCGGRAAAVAQGS